MKRKSLLVAMASVSLAAIGVGATSTLAWFQATGDITIKGNTADSEALTANTQATINLDAEINLSISEGVLVYDSAGAVTDANRTTQAAKGLQLTEYSSGAWIYKYLPNGKTASADAKTYAGESGKVAYKCFEYTVTYDLSTYTNIPAGSSAAAEFDANHTSAETLVVSVAKTLVSGSTDAANVGVFAISKTAPTAAWNPTSLNATSVDELTINAAHDSSAKFYVYVYASGADHAHNNSAPNANYTITIADPQ